MPDMRSSKYWGGGDAERTLRLYNDVTKKIQDDIKQKDIHINELNRSIDYSKQMIPKMQNLIKEGKKQGYE